MELEDFVRKINARYAVTNKKGGRNERVMWPDVQKQYYRFSEMVRFVSDLEDSSISILDVGCGNGELIRYLNFHGFKGTYTGIDLNEKLLSEARRLYPGIHFLSALSSENRKVAPHSYVMMSGIFNLSVGQDMNFVCSVIKQYYELSEKALIFNAVSRYVNFLDKNMYYLDLPELIEYVARNISPLFEVRHGFIPHNYTMCISKGNVWQSLNELQHV